MKHVFLSVAAVAVACGLSACASGPVQTPLAPVVMSEGSDVAMLTRDVTGKLDNKPFKLPGNTQWRRVGAVAQGDVYRSLGGRFSLPRPGGEDAYVVASSGNLVGFYLPGSQWFVPTNAQVLPLSKN